MKSIFLSLALVLLLASPLMGWEVKNLELVFGYTSETIPIEWDAATNCTSYDVRLKHVERGTYEPMQNTTSTQVVLQLPRTGHYEIEVRGVNNSTSEVGVWSSIIDPNTFTDPQLNPWWIYGSVEPVGPIIIN